MSESSFYVVMHTSGSIEIKSFDPEKDDILDVIHEELNGAFFEVVRCRTLPRKFIMLVDDCGAIDGCALNHLASELYGVRQHGGRIFGTAVFMKEDYVDGEPDIVGLTQDDTQEFVNKLHGYFVIKECE